MKTIRIYIDETLKYQRRMVFKVNDGMPESELNNLLDDVQRKAESSDDIPYLLERNCKDVQIVSVPDNDFSSPWSAEIEIVDFEELEEE